MSAATLRPNGLRINNPNRQIERISIDQIDVSDLFKKYSAQRITEELESLVTESSMSKTQQIDNILYTKEPLIKERNAILNNIFKCYNPYHRQQLKKIDAKLDQLDLQLYFIESEAEQIKSELQKEIKSAEEELKGILELDNVSRKK